MSNEWATPQDFFDRLDEEFHFRLDVCATKENTKCDLYFSEADNALVQRWFGPCWMNPPFGPGIDKWVRKAFASAWTKGLTVVCLLPVRSETAWWHEYVLRASEIRFVRQRLHFSREGKKGRAPFASAAVVFRGEVGPTRISTMWAK